MKSTGIVRKIDELGRFVLPIEIRKNLDIKERDSIEIFMDGERIILQKVSPTCIFCNNTGDMLYYMGKLICRDCAEKLQEQLF